MNLTKAQQEIEFEKVKMVQQEIQEAEERLRTLKASLPEVVLKAWNLKVGSVVVWKGKAHLVRGLLPDFCFEPSDKPVLSLSPRKRGLDGTWSERHFHTYDRDWNYER